jgi:phytoene dehydrogenase-like protein
MQEITRRGFIKGAGAAALAPLAFSPLGEPQQAATSERFDIVVAGAGHNSLVCAAYLAKAGHRVLVLEGRPTIGGGCKTQEVCLPGFKEDLCSSVHGNIRNSPVYRELRLQEFGLEYLDHDPVMHIPFLDGTSITVWHDLDRTCESIAKISKKDADTFRRLVPEVRGSERGAAAEAGRKAAPATFIQRLSAMSGYDAVKALYESRQMQAANLSTGHFGGVPGGDFGTGGQAFSMIGELNGRPMPKGGSGMFSVALGRFIEAHNGVILTNKPVAQLIIESGKCTGVECVDGSRYRAEKAVISTIHVKHLINMAPRELWGDEFNRDVAIFQPEHAMFSFHYATSEAPKYSLAGGQTISTTEAALMENPESVLVLNDYNARGVPFIEDMPLQIVSPSVGDPMRAPAGYHTVKIEGTMPYALKEGPQHWDVIKEEVAAAVFQRLTRVAPNFTSEKIVGRFLESPLDIERMNPAMWRGSAHHGDRRVPQFAPYKMPIPGLYQTGACTTPGGSITAIPGRNAAAALLSDLGSSLEEVNGKDSSGA